MAYGFGTTVNPQLGAVDYSNYLRGALSGAQMEAQGTAAIGQGIQNALSSIGQGIKKYQENKVLQAEIMGGVEGNVDFLVKNNPDAIASAPPEVQKILGRMEDGKGVSLKDSAYLKSWSDSTTKKTKVDIDKNAFLQSITPVDGKVPTGNESAFRYFQLGGTDRNAIATLLALANEPVNAKLRELQITAAEQATTGTTPITLVQQEQLNIQRSDAAAREADALVERERQAKADDRAAEQLKLSQAANQRAEEAATASTAGAENKTKLESMANKAIGLYQTDRNAYSAFLKGLTIEDQGVVLSSINQFERGIPRESALTPSAAAELLGRKSGKQTLAAYIASINSANIVETTGSKYVVKGMGNDIKRIPEFDLLLQQYPQLVPSGASDNSGIRLPGGGTLRRVAAP
jgi:hypothetical protein